VEREGFVIGTLQVNDSGHCDWWWFSYTDLELSLYVMGFCFCLPLQIL